MVAIIDYGMGNVASVKKALTYLNIPNILTCRESEIKQADIIILPGVGSFMQGMENLKERGLIDLLNTEVREKNKPFLGICLGMQLIFEFGNEPSKCNGLGWIKGEVLRIPESEFRVPHMGWNNITIKKDDYFKNIKNNDFYFIHSYYVAPVESKVIAATVDYGFPITASVLQDNIFATQFHPEKSQVDGLSILKDFVTLNA